MNLKVFKTIEIGALPKGRLLSELEKENYFVSNYVKDLIEKMPLSGKIEKIDVCKMTLFEMGFTEQPTWVQILEKVRELGDLCPPEVGPLLRLADTEQAKGSWYYVAMEPITDSGGNPFVFGVGRDGGGESWLDAGWVSPDGEWDLDDEVVFRLRKNPSTSNPQISTLEPLTLELAIKTVKDSGYKIYKEIN